MLVTVVACGAGELVAWAARVQSSNDPLAHRLFYMQYVQFFSYDSSECYSETSG